MFHSSRKDHQVKAKPTTETKRRTTHQYPKIPYIYLKVSTAAKDDLRGTGRSRLDGIDARMLSHLPVSRGLLVKSSCQPKINYL